MALTLYGRTGWGSALIEVQAAWYGLALQVIEVGDLFAEPAAASALKPLNPLAQVPTLVLEDGQILTESAAITLHLADRMGSDALVPAPGAAERTAFLRWLVFLVANIYPTFTYADDPARFVTVPEAQAPFRAAVDAYRERLWRQVENAAAGPFMLGPRLSALDLYIAVMRHWRPRAAWFDAQAPKLAAAARAVSADPRLAPVLERHFPQRSA